MSCAYTLSFILPVIRRFRGARWVCVDAPVAAVEKIPGAGTIGFDAAAAFVQQCMVGTT